MGRLLGLGLGMELVVGVDGGRVLAEFAVLGVLDLLGGLGCGIAVTVGVVKVDWDMFGSQSGHNRFLRCSCFKFPQIIIIQPPLTQPLTHHLTNIISPHLKRLPQHRILPLKHGRILTI